MSHHYLKLIFSDQIDLVMYTLLSFTKKLPKMTIFGNFLYKSFKEEGHRPPKWSGVWGGLGWSGWSEVGRGGIEGWSG